eukprot:TRINITY_DN32917_c0_g1_i1.p2 TRINITY_DN32917_c0_g1~~TRINITY_DN32917_c0_g1_i1.p2  ORF type:complete len:107 (+),score=17.05 TRINITY_DN32917_c0_g1_i1:529-849(+)
MPQEMNHSNMLPDANNKTNNQRGCPQIYIGLDLLTVRPRITGAIGGRNFAARWGENFLTVLVTFSLKVIAKLSFRIAILTPANTAATSATGFVKNANPRRNVINMK